MQVLRTMSSGIRSSQVWTLHQAGQGADLWVLDLNRKIRALITDLGYLRPYDLQVVNPIKGPFQVLIRSWMEVEDKGPLFYQDNFYAVKYGGRFHRGKLVATLIRTADGE